VPLADAGRIVRDVAAVVGLAEGERGVRSVLAAVGRLEPVPTRRLARTVDLPVPFVASICGELRKRGVVAEQRPNQLTPLGRELYGDGVLRLGGTATCSKCAGRGVVARGEVAHLLADMRRIARLAPPVRRDLDQCHCTPETKLHRVLAFHEADALVGRRVLVLGDDDLMSLAIERVVRRLGSGQSIELLAVVDVDPAVLDVTRHQLARAPFPTACVLHDVREPLPASARAGFDTVLTDPPYTGPGATLFLSRAVEALGDAGGDVFFSFGSRRPGAGLHLQQAIASAGLSIVSLRRDFNEYVGAGVLAGTSSLYHLSASSASSPLLDVRYDGPLYTADPDPVLLAR
jgi:predicted methyltransferase